MTTKIIDVHCHLFNRHVLTYRIIWNLIKSLKYLTRSFKEQSKPDENQVNQDSVFKSLVEFLEEAFLPEPENVYKDLLQVYNGDVYIVPLTFDLEYCFESKSDKSSKKERIKSMQKNFQVIRDDFDKAYYGRHNNNLSVEENSTIHYYKEKLDEKIDIAFKSESRLRAFLRRIFSRDKFSLQLREMLKLSDKYPGKIFPFLAIDPRRKGIFSLLKKYTVTNQKFYGIKIYCPTGYLPTDPLLFDKGGVYDYCIENNLPVLAHFSGKGFATLSNSLIVSGYQMIDGKLEAFEKEIVFEKEVYSDGWIENRANHLNSPEQWEIVLQNKPGLKLNLAHFGNSNDRWHNWLVNAMQKYKNLYTDLAAYGLPEEIEKVKKLYWDQDSLGIRSQILYGSDFYFNLLFTKSFDDYYAQFRKIFSTEDWKELALENTQKFLGFEV